VSIVAWINIGARLELSSINSWGDVVEIRMRSIKIFSVENRMVVLPNSVIGKSEIINYSYPDPSYFDLVNILVGYSLLIRNLSSYRYRAIFLPFYTAKCGLSRFLSVIPVLSPTLLL